jgi:hypothetical protein
LAISQVIKVNLYNICLLYVLKKFFLLLCGMMSYFLFSISPHIYFYLDLHMFMLLYLACCNLSSLPSLLYINKKILSSMAISPLLLLLLAVAARDKE